MHKVNGVDHGGEPQLTVNAIEVAQLTLMFLSRADFKRHERQQFDLCEALLTAIASGRVRLAQAEDPNGAPLQATQEAAPPVLPQ
jgi:hypothetical protein